MDCDWQPDEEGRADHERQYSDGPGRPSTEAELDTKYPHRPRNIHKTLPFHDLIQNLFDPLLDARKSKGGNPIARKKQGPHGPAKLSPTEIRNRTIQQWMSRWRNEVGDDFYPAFRLIVPDKDRDRPMYGLKEKAIASLLIKLLKIGKKTTDAANLLEWKKPGEGLLRGGAGDFPERCSEVLKKRAMRNQVGDMRIAEVNELLDRLAAAGKEDEQLPIFTEFYQRMNADELTWLIRVILRRLNMGATEKTFFSQFHQYADAIFNVSSSLRRVCWELSDPNNTEGFDNGAQSLGIELMSCFQPQLAQFQTKTFELAVKRLGVTQEDPQFWIEEKLDGERIQMHMMENDKVPGGFAFAWWSRKAKDYTHLYGTGYEDKTSALTRHIRTAFHGSVRNIILDGEMITWDPEADVMVPFGTLKTAALSEQRDPYAGNGTRPLFRIFDLLYLNDRDLTRYTLRDRRKALEGTVTNIHRRMEIHDRTITDKVTDIEPRLRDVVAGQREGLVLKNPRSLYQLNSRVDDWVKVKPEYYSGYGENLDCVIIGGFYGSGKRGHGRYSSFMCGLRVDKNEIDKGARPDKFYSFFKVGGGFSAQDYANIREKTDGKWNDWDRKNPPREYIETGSGEIPDVWILPADSVVIEVKASETVDSESFATRYSLRFPRFRRLRTDKSWETALSIQDFVKLKNEVETEARTMTLEGAKKRISKRLKGERSIAGNDSKIYTPYAGPKTNVFEGLSFYVLTDMTKPKKSKAELEQIIKSNGGNIFQRATQENIVCVAEKKLVKVASLIKAGHHSIVKPTWILEAIKQAEADGPQRSRYILPMEPRQMFHMTVEVVDEVESAVDIYGDSYARDVSKEELTNLFGNMVHPKNSTFSPNEFFTTQIPAHGVDGFKELPGSMFRGTVVRFVPDIEELDSKAQLESNIAKYKYTFASGKVAESDDEEEITHFVVVDSKAVDVKALLGKISRMKMMRFPRVVGMDWLKECWEAKTLLDEERFLV